MTYPVYDATASYEVGNKITYNNVVYLKTPYGEEGTPGTADSFWLDIEADKVASAETGQTLKDDLVQQLTDAGFKPQYVVDLLRDYFY